MWKVREDEPAYAFLKGGDVPAVNHWDAPIDLIARTGGEMQVEAPLPINDEAVVGCNPNRNKQHGFHFTADNCIGCHACEAACSEKNDNPAHISFRSVGYVEGGSFPDVKRMNISMACNHCDDPVCLKGCPTRAYTKHAEYGAVLQDPDTCFGCGYCTWVCPYNAPQLDPIKGQVSKCNMCIDRLEVNLKPACVSACLGNALGFGIVEELPENRDQGALSIPGFPDPSITHPNIRFQQLKALPEEMARPDGMAVKYRKDAEGGYRPTVDPKRGVERQWNFKRLSSRENPLLMFTLVAQAGVGAFTILLAGQLLGWAPMQQLREHPAYLALVAICVALAGLGMLLSATHLGKPLRFYRGFNNLRWSPVSREGLGIVLFMVFAGLHFLSVLPENPLFISIVGDWGGLGLLTLVPAILALICGFTGLYYMVKCYRIPARPFWNHWQTGTAFAATALSIGALLVALFLVPVTGAGLTVIAALIATACAVEGFGLWHHARDMTAAEHEGAVSHYAQQTVFGKTARLRVGLLSVSGVLALLTALAAAVVSPWVLLPLAFAVLTAAIIGRALFYVLVVPTTMPGAFFWKNKDFEEHAREIGLADMPQVGVVAHSH